jgi:undecaprenyl-diphosphatase
VPVLGYGQALLFGLLQGLTEFLPVSSSGHLVLARAVLGLRTPGLGLEVALHAATAVAVLFHFRADFLGLLRAALGWRRGTPQFGLFWRLALATLPAAAAGYFLRPAVEEAFASPRLVAGMLILTAAALLLASRLPERGQDASSMSWGAAALIGLAQATGLMPGISRSGATTVAGLLVGLGRREAARFSLLLAVPVILGAGAADLLGLAGTAGGEGALAAVGLGPLSLALAVAFAVGLAALRLLIWAVDRAKLGWFGFYCLAVALSFLALGPR